MLRFAKTTVFFVIVGLLLSVSGVPQIQAATTPVSDTTFSASTATNSATQNPTENASQVVVKNSDEKAKSSSFLAAVSEAWNSITDSVGSFFIQTGIVKTPEQNYFTLPGAPEVKKTEPVVEVKTVQQPVIVQGPEKIVERVVSVPQKGNYVTQAFFQTTVDLLQNQIDLLNQNEAVSTDSVTREELEKRIDGLQRAIAYTGQPLQNVTITNNGLSTGNGSFTSLNVSGNSTLNSLSVTGSATSTFGGGVNITGDGCFAINGICVAGGTGSGILTINGLGAVSQTFATSSDTNIHIDIVSSGSTHTFVPSWAGTLSIARGGTGVSTAPTYGQLLVGNNSGGYDLVSTSSLGIAGGSSQWSTNGSSVYYSGGNVGIGTSSPSQALSVNGTVYATAFVGDGSGLTGISGSGASFSTTSVDYWLTTKSTSNLAEGSNLYFTNNRVASVIAGTTTDALAQGSVNKYYSDSLARNAISSSALGLTYTSGTGAFSLTSGYSIPLTASTTDWNTAYLNRITSATSPLSISSNAISISQASGSANGYLASGDWITFNNKFATSSTQYLLSTYDKGYFFSTTSTDYWLTTKNVGGFSTTSADAWDLTKNRWATTSASYFLSTVDKGYFYSTTSAAYNLSIYDKGYFYSSTSADYWLSTKSLSGFSSTSADFWLTTKSTSNLTEGSNLYYTPARVAGVIAGTTTDALAEGSVNKYYTDARARASISTTVTGLTYTAGTGVLSQTAGYSIPLTASTTDWNTAYLNRITSATSPLSISSNAISISQANGSTDGYLASADWITFNNKFATTSTNYLLSTIDKGYFFSTTSTDYWLTTKNVGGFSTTSADAWDLTKNRWATTSASYFLSTVDKGYFFSTTSANYNLSTIDKGYFYSTTSEAYNLSTYDKGYFYSTTSANYWLTTKTTDNLSEGSTNLYYTAGRDIKFSTTSASYFADSSTTIAKTYSNNTFSGANTFNGTFTLGSLNGPLQANAGVVTASSSIGVLYGGTGLTSAPSYGQLLLGNSNGGYTLTATTSLGITSSQWITNGTSIYYNGGNVGIGTTSPSSKFSVNGDSNLAGNVVVSGNLTPSVDNFYSLGTASFKWKDLFIGPGSLYVNNQKVISTDVGSNVNITADPNQSILIKPSGTGDIELNPTGSGNIILKNNVKLSSAYAFSLSNGQAVPFTGGVLADNIKVAGNSITANNLNGGISLTPDGSGGVYVTTGNFGIGTTGPAMKLSVNGAGLFNGTVTATSFIGDGSQLSGLWATTSTNYLLSTIDKGYFFSTTSSNYNLSVFDKGYFFSTTSSDYWLTTKSLSAFSSTSADYWLTTKSTSNLTEGSNLYYTPARVAGVIAGTTTDALAEGTTNKYYTDTRARSALSSTIPGVTYTSGTGVFSLTAGYNVPLTASTTNWNGFYDTPSTRITAGTGLSWAGNTLNATASGVVGSGTTGQLAYYAAGGTTLTATSTLFLDTTGNVGIASTSPFAKLSVGGNTFISGSLTATGAVIFSGLGNGCLQVNSGIVSSGICGGGGSGGGTWATTTSSVAGILTNYPLNNSDIVAIGSNSTTTAKFYFDPNTQTSYIAGTLTLGTLNGPLQGNNGVISATSSIGVLYGGTGLTSAPSYGQILVGNASSGYTLTATSSLGLLSFSTTSADYYLGTKDKGYFFSTTSANYNLSIFDKGYFFSTTSTDYWLTTKSLSAFSSTSADYWLTTKSTSNLTEGSNLYYTPARVAGVIAGTTTDALAEGSVNKYYTDARARASISTTVTGLTYTAGTGVLSQTAGYSIPLTASTTDWNTAYLNRITSATSPLSISSNAISISQANGSTDGYLASADWITFNNKFATSSTQYLIGTYDKGYFYSTTSADYWLTTKSLVGFSTTSANYYLSTIDKGYFFSTTSANYNLSVFDKGYFYSTTSANYWLTTKTTDNLSEGSTNLYYTAGRDIKFSTTSADYYLSVYDKNQLFSTTSANYYVNASTTIPKTYTNNTFAGANTFNGTLTVGSLNGPLQANAGVVSATSSIGVLYGGTGLTAAPSYGQVLVGNASSGYTLTATSSLGLLSFSTTSADYYLGTKDKGYFFSTTSANYNLSIFDKGYFFSTTSANYNLSVFDKGYFYSTTSANYWLTTKTTDNLSEGSTNLYYTAGRDIKFSTTSADYYVNSSTTIPKTYSNNTFTGANTFNGTLTIGSLNGPLQANAGVVSATTSIGVKYGGTGLTASPTYGQLLIGNASSGYTLSATSTLGINLADTTGTLTVARGGTGATSFTTGQPLYYNGSTFVSTSTISVAYGGTGSTTLTGLLKGNGVAGIQTAVGGTDYEFPLTFNAPITRSVNTISIAAADGATNGYLTSSDWITFNNKFATTSTNYWLTTKTTDNLTEGSTNLYYTAGRDIKFSTTSADYHLSVYDKGFFFSTTSANYYVNSSTTIPKTYSNNTFTGSNTFNSTLTVGSLNGPLQANAGVISATSSIGVLYGGTGLTAGPSFGQVLVGNASSGYTLTATSSLGLLSFSTTSADYYLGTKDKGYFFSTTSANYNLSIFDKGYFFSTTSSDYFLSTKSLSGFFSTTSTDYWLSTKSTTNLAEGSNLYYTNGRVDARFVTDLAATSSVDSITTLNNLSAVGTLISGSIGSGFGSINIGSNQITAGNGIFSGNVGIGTTSPYAKLAVVGQIVGSSFTGTSNATSTFAGGINVSGGCLAVNGICINDGLVSSQWTTTGSDIYFDTGDVGIGVTTPGFPLDVAGDINLTGNLLQGGQTTFVANNPNTFVGLTAGAGITSGTNDTFIGYQAGYNNNTGSESVAVGTNALYNSRSNSNTAIGYQAGYGTFGVTTRNNTLIGYQAGYSFTSAADNVMIGYNVGTTTTSGARNILIGSVLARSATDSDFLNIGNTLYGDLSAGNIGVGTTTPGSKLSVAGNGYFTGSISASNFSGSSSGTNTGDVTIGTANGLSLVGQQISLALASGSTNGALSSSDWISFNNKFATTSTQYLIGTYDKGYFYSTTSSNYWLTTKTTDNLSEGSTNLYYTAGRDIKFSTTSADYYLSLVDRGQLFSTTSANYFVHSSTTIPKTYTNNTFAGANTFNGTLTVGSLNGPLQANAGVVSATSSIGVLYGGTGLTAAPSYGQVLVGNASSGYTLTATSSLGLLSFSTTSADYYLGTKDKGYFFSTTSANYNLSIFDKGYFFSTTSANYNLSVFDKGYFYSTTSANYWLTTKTTDNLSEGSTNLYYTAGRDIKFATTSADYYLSVYDKGQLFSTTSANYFVHSSTTIAKAYSNNTFTGTNTFNNTLTIGSLNGPLQAINGVVSASSSLSVAYGGTGSTTLTGLLKGNGVAGIQTAVAGTDYESPLTFNAPITRSVNTISIAAANGSTNGYLASSDWIAFNNKFATTSTDYWLTTKSTTNLSEGTNLYYTVGRDIKFATTSADYYLSVYDKNQLFSTTSANYYVNASTTIPKTYSNNTFTGSNTFNSTLTVGSLNGPLQANAGVVSATSSIGVLYGGTGLTSAPSYGQLLVGNASSGYTLTATSSLGLLSSTAIGSGTTGQFPYYAANGNTLTATSSIFVASNGNIGIGTTTPGDKLDIFGNSTAGDIFIGNSFQGGYNSIYLNGLTGLGNYNFASSKSDTTLYINRPSGRDIIFQENNVTSGLYLKSGGSVGVGTTSPFTTFAVAGSGYFSGTVGASNLSGTNTGDITLGTANGLSLVGQQLSLGLASGSATGALSSSDWISFNNKFATTSTQYLLSTYDKGYFYSTTSEAYNLSTYDKGYFYSTTSANYWLTTKTTDNLSEGSTNLYYTAGRDIKFATSSADYYLSVYDKNQLFSTTSANYYVNASTTIPKTYTNNTFAGANTFNGTLTVGSLNGPLQANAGVVSATSSIGVLYGGTGLTSAPSYGQLLVGNASGGYTLTATSSLGLTSQWVTIGSNIAYTNGGVGIGTSTISSKLVVDGGRTYLNSNDNFTLGLGRGSYNNNFYLGVSTAASNPDLILSNSGGTEVARFVGSGGNVGIATSSPYAKLSVAGQVVGQNFTATSTTASSTLPLLNVTNAFQLGSDYITDITGNGLSVSGNALTCNTANGSTFGCLSSADWAIFNNKFATTSTDYYLSQVDKGYFFSTTSANYNLSVVDKGYFYSTTSANYWLTTKTTDNLSEGSTNLYYTAGRDIKFSTTSADYYLSLVDRGQLFSTTSANYFVHSSTTIPKTYTNNTFAGANTFNGTLTVGSLTGPLQAVNGAVSASSTIAVAYGGTGWSSIQSGALIYGNGANRLSTTSAGTAGQVLALLNGVPTWTATTTFGTGLSYSNGTVTNTGVLSIGPIGQVQNPSSSGVMLIATSTNTTNGLTSAITVIGAGGGNPTLVFTPSISGTLTVAGGGTGLSSAPSYGQILVGNASSGYTLTATSSLGLGTVTGTGVSGRVAYWNGTNALTSNSSFTFDGTNLSAAGIIGSSYVNTPLLDQVGTITDASGDTSVDVSNRQLVTDAGSTVMADWSNSSNGFTVPSLYSTSNPFNITSNDGSDPAILHLGNQTGASGAIFENGSLDLVDFGFKTSTGVQNNLRTEHRSAFLKNSANSTYGEFQFYFNPLGYPTTDAYNLIVGQNVSSFLTGNVGVGTSSPWTKFAVSGNVDAQKYYSNGLLFGFATSSSSYFLAGATATTTVAVTGTNNFIAGRFAGANLTSGSYNAFIGFDAGWKNTTGTNNVFIGKDAGTVNTTGSQNVFLGLNAGTFNIDGSYNIFEGFNAGQQNVSGNDNIFLGQNAGLTNQTASGLIGIGYSSLRQTTTSSSTALGYNAGQVNTTGIYNTFLGYGADASVGTLTNATAIGANAVVGASNSLVLGNGVNVGIGTSSPYAKLSVAGTIVGQNFVGTSTATSTFGGGINIASGCFAVNGTCITAGGGSGTVGSGLAGQFPYYAAGGTTLTATSTLFLTTTGKVGVGTTSPLYKLDVNGTLGNSSGDLTVSAGDTTNFATSGILKLFAANANDLTVDAGLTLNGVTKQISLYSGDGSSLVFDGVQNITLDNSDGSFLTVGSSGNYALYSTGNLSISSEASVKNYFDATYELRNRSTDYPYIIANGITNNVGVGTTSPYAKLSVAGTIVGANFVGTTTATSTFGGGLNITSGCFSINGSCVGSISGSQTPWTGNINGAGFNLTNAGIITGTVLNATSTTATSTFSGGLSVGNGALQYDFSSGLTSIDNLQVGASSFETNAGMVSWTDMLVTSGASSGTVESYSARLNGNAMLTVYGESDGSGGTQNTGVGIGSTTPWGKLSVNAAGGAPAFAVGSSTGTQFIVNSTGNVGIGTTSPYAKLSVAGTIVGANFIGTTTATSTFAGGIAAGIFNATSATASSTFANGINLTNGCFAVNGTCISGGGGSGTVGSGTTGQFPYYAAGGTTLTATSSLFLASNGNVGIGTTSPYAKLSVNGQTVAQYFTATSTSIASRFPYASSTAITVSGKAYITQGIFTSGILDGSNVLSIDSSNRKIYGSDGTTVQIDYSLANAISLAGAGSPVSSSIFAGYQSGTSASNASNATFIGYQAGNSATNAANSIFIGTNAGSSDSVDNTSLGSVNTVNSTPTNGGSGYQVGDVLTIATGSNDATVQVTGISGDAVTGVSANAGATGSGYTYGDQITITGAGNGDAIVQVDGLGSGGYVLDMSVVSGGSGYTSATNVTTSGGTGSGLNVDITVSGGVISITKVSSGTSGYPVRAGLSTTGGSGSGATVEVTSVTGGTSGTSIAIGQYAGTGGYRDSIALGHGVTNSAINQFNIGNVLYGTGIYGSNSQSSNPTATGKVGIGTTSPYAKLSITAPSSSGLTSLLAVASSSGATLFNVLGNGNVGIGTSSPYAKLSVVGQTVAQYFTATSTSIASTFPYASTTALTVSSALMAYGSSTIGNGLQAGGLTISGGATTTGSAYFVGSVNGNGGFTVPNGANYNIPGYDTNLGTNTLRLYGFNQVVGDNTGNLTLGSNGSLYVASTGNVGVGTTSPYAKLSVAGTIVGANFIGTTTATSTLAGGLATNLLNVTSTTASSTFANGINLTNGCFAVNGTCISGGGGSGTVGTGLVGQVPYYAAGGTALTATSSLFIDTTSNVGIGTSTPLTKLDVLAGNNTSGIIWGQTLRNSGNSGGTGYGIGLKFKLSTEVGAESNKWLGLAAVAGTAFANQQDLAIYAGANTGTPAELFRFAGSGNFGIGTNNPQASLSIVGTSTVASLINVASSTGTTVLSLSNSGYLGIGTSAATSSLEVVTPSDSSQIVWGETLRNPANAGVTGYGVGLKFKFSSNAVGGEGNKWVGIAGIASATFADQQDLVFYTNNSTSANPSEKLRLTSTGSLGLGTTSPFARLSVTGTTSPSTTSVFVVASSTNQTLFSVLGNGNVGIGTTTPYAALSVVGQVVAANFIGTTTATSTLAGGLSTNLLNVTSTTATSTFANGINITGGCFAVNGTCFSGGAGSGTVGSGTAGQFPYYAAGGTTLTATSSLFIATSGNIGIGTTSPYAKLSVAGLVVADSFNATNTAATSTFAGGFDVGNGALRYDFSSGVTSIDNLQLGALSFDTNAGVVTWTDLPVTSSASAGTKESYSAKINGNNLLTIYGESDGSGGVQNTGVGIGSSTPWAKLSVSGAAGFASFAVGSSTGTQFIISSLGNVGIGTTSPYAKLSVAGQVVADTFNATSTTATSTFSGGLSVGNGSLKYDYSSGVTSIDNLQIGATTFDTNAGIVSWTDMPVTSAASAGTKESYSAQINGNALLTVYGESDGSGGVQNLAVGIGTTSPYAKLSVVGTVVAANFVGTTTATSTFGGGINITSGCFAVNGTCFTGGSGGVGSGTIGQLPYYGAVGTNVTATSSLFLASNGNFGIGSTSPFSKLSVFAKNGETNTSLFSVGSTTGSTITTLFDISNTGQVTIGDSSAASDASFQFGNDNNAWSFGYNSSDKTFRIASSTNLTSQVALSIAKQGYVGIGTSSPQDRLTVEAGNDDTFAFMTGNTNGFQQLNLQNRSNGNLASTDFVVTNDIGTATSYYLDLGINGSQNTDATYALFNPGDTYLYSQDTALNIGTASTTNTANGILRFFTNGTASSSLRMVINQTGVGIGTSSPSSKLSVSGNTYFDSNVVTFGSSTASSLTFALQKAATTTIPLTVNAWSIASSSNAQQPIINIGLSTNGSSSTVGFFVATTSFLQANTLAVNSAIKNHIIVGNGKIPASIDVMNGGLCVDNDGFCAATTTGRITVRNTIQTGNADLAEVYTTTDTLEAGDLVTSAGGFSVAKANPGDSVMGVVSTKPGLILGLLPEQTEYDPGNVPVALSGRVPVKVSPENGVIHKGDYLALSTTTPGMAVKATQAGMIVAQALQDYNGPVGGNVLAFVRNTYFSGALPSLLPGLTMDTTTQPSSEQYLVNNGISTGSLTSSSTTLVGSTTISGGLAVAANANFSGQVRIDTLSVGALSYAAFDQAVAKLNTVATTVDALSTRVASLEASTAFASSSVAATTTSFDALTLKNLTVQDAVVMNGGLKVNTISGTGDIISMLSDVEFIGRPYFTSDTGGTAIIKTGAKSVTVTFDRDYVEVPVVNATMSFDATSTLATSTLALATSTQSQATTTDEILDSQIFSNNISYAVVNKTVHGFTIRLNKAAPANVSFNWIALAIKNSKLFTSIDQTVTPPAPITEPVTTTPSGTTSSSTQTTSTTTETSTTTTSSTSTSTETTTSTTTVTEPTTSQNDSTTTQNDTTSSSTTNDSTVITTTPDQTSSSDQTTTTPTETTSSSSSNDSVVITQ